MKKIYRIAEINSIKERFLEKKTVLVGGCFDIFHYAHLKFLQEAKKAGDILIIALESDRFIKERKKRLPFHSQKERAEILASLEVVDAVLTLPFWTDNDKYMDMVKSIRPVIVAVSQNDPQISNKKKQIEAIGGKIKEVLPLISKFSSTKIIKYETISGN